MFNLIKWFQLKFPNIVKEMKNSNHHYDEKNLNPYHLEGDVWTHTLMVYNYAYNLDYKNNNLLLAALLHDVGKPTSRMVKEDTLKVRFFNHENISTYYAIDILLELKKDEPSFEFDLLQVLLLINWHSDFHSLEIKNGIFSNDIISFINKKYSNLELYMNMISLNEADNYGRITEIENEQGAKEKFEILKSITPFDNSYINENNPIAIILVGIPATGKSTYIKKISNENNKEFIILSTDDIIQEKYPDLEYNQAFERIQSKGIFNEIENEFFNRLKNAVKDRKNIIVDQTNLTKKSRRKKLNIIPTKYYVKKGVVFLRGKQQQQEFANKRKLETNKFINPMVINNMVSNFIVPGLDEFDLIEYIY